MSKFNIRQTSEPSKKIEMNIGEEIANMRKVGKFRWSNRVSEIEVRDGCAVSGFNKPNFEQLVGVWVTDTKLGVSKGFKIKNNIFKALIKSSL